MRKVIRYLENVLFAAVYFDNILSLESAYHLSHVSCNKLRLCCTLCRSHASGFSIRLLHVSVYQTHFFKFCSFLAPPEPFAASSMSPTPFPTPSVPFLYQYHVYPLLSLCASKFISLWPNRAYDIVVSSGPSPWQRWGSHRVVRALQRLQARYREHWVCGCDDCDLPTGEPPV